MAKLSTVTRRKVFICNIIISLLCVLSIVSYFIFPFWKVNVSLDLTAETIQTMLEEATQDASSENGESAGDATNEGAGESADYSEALSQLDFSEIVQDGVTIELSITLKTTDILSSLSSDPAVLVEKILSDNVNNMVNQLTPTIDQVSKNVVKALTKTVLTEQLKAQLKDKLGETATDEEVKAEMEALGLTEDYIATQTSTLVDSLYQEGTTPESAAQSTVNVVKDALNKIQSSGKPEYANMQMDAEDEAELKDGLVEIFQNFADENGNLNLEGFVTDMLMQALTGEGEGETNGENAGENAGEGKSEAEMQGFVYGNRSSIANVSDAPTEEEVSEDLQTALTDMLMESLGEATETIAKVVKIISYVILFTFFTWFYVILKILVKLGMKNNAVKLKVPLWLGSIPFWVLYLAPTIALKILFKPDGAILGGMEAGMGKVLLEALSIKFFTCAWISFVIGAFLFFFAWFYYKKLRKTLRKIKKGKMADVDVSYNEE